MIPHGVQVFEVDEAVAIRVAEYRLACFAEVVADVVQIGQVDGAVEIRVHLGLSRCPGYQVLRPPGHFKTAWLHSVNGFLQRGGIACKTRLGELLKRYYGNAKKPFTSASTRKSSLRSDKNTTEHPHAMPDDGLSID